MATITNITAQVAQIGPLVDTLKTHRTGETVTFDFAGTTLQSHPTCDCRWHLTNLDTTRTVTVGGSELLGHTNSKTYSVDENGVQVNDFRTLDAALGVAIATLIA